MRYIEQFFDNVDEWAALSDSWAPAAHQYSEPGQWWSSMTVQNTASYTLLRSEKRGEELLTRSPSLLQGTSIDNYWIMMPEAGVHVARSGDHVLHFPPGQALVIRLDRPITLHMPTPSKVYVLGMPSADIDNRLSKSEPTHMALGLEGGLGRVVMNMIRTTQSERDGLTTREFNSVCDRITELLCLLFIGDGEPPQAQLTETTEAIRRFVRDNIGVSDTRLPAAAQALGWSPRHLKSILRRAGTTYLEVRQDEAMRAARDMLEWHGPHAMSISEIAARAGFSKTWFWTAFKARYGETPRDFQRRKLQEAPDA